MITSVKKAVLSVLVLAAVFYMTGCDGPFPQPGGGDDMWPMTGVMTVCVRYTNETDMVYVIHQDNSLWQYTVSAAEESMGEQLYSQKVMDNVRSIYWAGGSYRILAHTMDGGLWLLGATNLKMMDDVECISTYGVWTWAVKTDGTLWEWGCEEVGTNGGAPFYTDDYEVYAPPEYIMDNVRYVSVGWDYSLAVCRDGTLWLREHKAPPSSETYYYSDGSLRDIYANRDGKDPVKIMDNVKYAAVPSTRGNESYAMVIDNDGALWSYLYKTSIYPDDYDSPNPGFAAGYDTETTEGTNTPVKILEDVLYVSVSFLNAMAVKEDGSLWYWGLTEMYENKHAEVIIKPVKIWDDATRRIIHGNNHIGAVRADGSMWLSADAEHNVSPEDGESVKVADALTMVRMAENVLFEYEKYLIMRDGSLRMWRDASTNKLVDKMLIPPGKVRISESGGL